MKKVLTINFNTSVVRLALLCLVLFSCFYVRAEESKVERFKAAFIYKFSKFVSWRRKDINEGLKIGFVGTHKFKESIETISKQTYKDKKIIVSQGDTLEEVGDCHIIFFGSLPHDDFSKMLEKLKYKECLTISDMDTAGEHEVIIKFYMKGNKLRFKIEAETAETAGVKLSAALLKLGR